MTTIYNLFFKTPSPKATQLHSSTHEGNDYPSNYYKTRDIESAFPENTKQSRVVSARRLNTKPRILHFVIPPPSSKYI